MRYALLIYGNVDVRDRMPADERRRIDAGVAAILERPEVSGWLRLHDPEAATTTRCEQRRTLLIDGPFLESKDFLGGLVIVEAEDLDDALSVAEALQVLRGAGAIEIRPVREEPLVGA